jgi:hypothetical protein
MARCEFVHHPVADVVRVVQRHTKEEWLAMVPMQEFRRSTGGRLVSEVAERLLRPLFHLKGEELETSCATGRIGFTAWNLRTRERLRQVPLACPSCLIPRRPKKFTNRRNV